MLLGRNRAALSSNGLSISHLEFLLCKSTYIVKGHSGYTFFQIAWLCFLGNGNPGGDFSKGITTLTIQLCGGLERKGLGLWTILRVVATPVPAIQSNPIQSMTICNYNVTTWNAHHPLTIGAKVSFRSFYRLFFESNDDNHLWLVLYLVPILQAKTNQNLDSRWQAWLLAPTPSITIATLLINWTFVLTSSSTSWGWSSIIWSRY